MAQQGFPNLNSRIVDENGSLAAPWHRLFIELWQRTGAASGKTSYSPGTGGGDGFVSPDDGLLPALFSDPDAPPASVDLSPLLFDHDAPISDPLAAIMATDQLDQQADQSALAFSLLDLPDAKASKPAAIKTITVGASPFAYAATADGDAYLDGGTGLSIAIARQGASFTLAPTSGFFPLTSGDVLTVTYATVPRLLFIPRIA